MNQILPLLIIGIVFTAIVAIVFIALYFQNQRRRDWHETARLALEKGQPIPVRAEASAPAETNSDCAPGARNDVRSGLVLVAVGAGLYLSFSSIGFGGFPMMGAYIPGFIGVALLLNGLITAVTTRRSGRDHDVPPAA